MAVDETRCTVQFVSLLVTVLQLNITKLLDEIDKIYKSHETCSNIFQRMKYFDSLYFGTGQIMVQNIFGKKN